jgi:hypothetical protein
MVFRIGGANLSFARLAVNPAAVGKLSSCNRWRDVGLFEMAGNCACSFLFFVSASMGTSRAYALHNAYRSRDVIAADKW